jgi:hypothetical protein
MPAKRFLLHPCFQRQRETRNTNAGAAPDTAVSGSTFVWFSDDRRLFVFLLFVLFGLFVLVIVVRVLRWRA